MSEPTYPPIPPNCEQFKVRGHNAFFYVPSESNFDFDTVQGWLDSDIAWRPIIAAVARSAWLDEAAEKVRYYESPIIEEARASFEQYKNALRCADQWAKWGRGEKWI